VSLLRHSYTVMTTNDGMVHLSLERQIELAVGTSARRFVSVLVSDVRPTRRGDLLALTKTDPVRPFDTHQRVSAYLAGLAHWMHTHHRQTFTTR